MAIWLRIFCAVLLLALGFAHKPLQAAPVNDPTSSLYVLPDGTFADLCIDNDIHGQPHKSWLGSGCDLCRLSGSVLLPTPPADYLAAAADYRFAIFPPAAEIFVRTAERPGSPVRGPPSFHV